MEAEVVAREVRWRGRDDEKVMWKDSVNREKCILVVSAA